ncbi:peptidoglycan-binding protein [Actinomadura sp. SCN-SB]|uniref:peptidoglycan-binding domain-containing protein n=1 Tax=Actinomadura sp. SCN-SB TaxID=3373092 RepID=UPI003751FA14
MSLARNALKPLTALPLVFALVLAASGAAGTGVAAADGPDTPRGVKARIEALPWPVLERGVTHWRVWSVKRILGVPTSSQGDVYNDALHRAITRYQESRDLAERNRIGTETWENLRYTVGVVRPGATGGKVFAVQRALRHNGHPKLAVDGIYGTRTEQAVRQFQRKVGIQVDGVTGRFTFRALICMGA